MCLTLLLAGALIKFPGGSTNDFVKFLASATSRDVVAAQSWVKPVPAFEFDPKSFEAMVYETNRKSGLRFYGGSDLILGDQLLPPEFMGPTKLTNGAPRPAWKTISAGDIEGGKVTFHTDGDQRLAPGSLAEAPLSKPVIVHWMLKDVPLSVSSEHMEERTFLTFVAKSMGGKLVDDKKNWTIDFTPSELRARALKVLALKADTDVKATPEPQNLKSSIDMVSFTLQNISDDQIAQAFKAPGAQVRIPNPPQAYSTALYKLILTLPTTDTSNPKVPAFKTPNGMQPVGSFRLSSVTVRSDFTVTYDLLGQSRGRTPPQQMNLTFSMRS